MAADEPTGVKVTAPSSSGLTQIDADEFTRQSNVVHRTGRMVLAAGHGSYRVKAHMQRVGKALGLDAVKAHVALTEISTTAVRGGLYRTEVSEVRTVGINANRLAELDSYISGLEGEATAEQVTAELDRIESLPYMYRGWFNAFAAGMACAAFALLNGGGWVECLLVLVAAATGQFVRRTLVHRGINQVGVTMLAAALSCSIYLLLMNALGWLVAEPGAYVAGYISAILYLVPGFPLVTSALDLFRLDLSAGISRLTYALMLLASGAMSLWVVSALMGVSPQADAVIPQPWQPVWQLDWGLRALASFVGVMGFAILFNSPWRMAFAAATVGMVANLLRLVLISGFAWTPPAAAAVAALLVGLLARVLADRVRAPRLTISVPAVVIMVPGVSAYRAMFAASMGDQVAAVSYGLAATLVVLGLAVGLGVARMLTDRDWTFER